MLSTGVILLAVSACWITPALCFQLKRFQEHSNNEFFCGFFYIAKKCCYWALSSKLLSGCRLHRFISQQCGCRGECISRDTAALLVAVSLLQIINVMTTFSLIDLSVISDSVRFDGIDWCFASFNPDVSTVTENNSQTNPLSNFQQHSHMHYF